MLSYNITRYLKQYHICQKPLYVACSGGRDSLVLAYLCICLHKQGVLPKPTLIHINHNLQAYSRAWADGVRDFAKSYDVPCRIISLTLSDTSEQGARQARYRAFFDVMVDGGVIALAHHQDDQAETVLMRIITGTGVKGLGGMRVWQSRQDSKSNKTIYLFRPLLTASRADISAYAKAYALPYVNDPTNDTGDNMRAILRRQIMPVLRQLNPKAVANIARSASLAQNSHRLIDGYVANQLKRCLINTSPYWQCTLGDKPLYDWQTRLDISHLMALTANDTASDELTMVMLHAFIQGDEPNAAPYAFVCRVKDLCQKTTTDHQTTLHWQGQSAAWVFVRYDKVLYRYHEAVWQALQEQLNAHIDVDNQLVCLMAKNTKSGHNSVGLFANFDKILTANSTIIPLIKLGNANTTKTNANKVIDTKISVNIGTDDKPNNKSLSGKKLYQTLRIPVWCRKHLFCVYGDDWAYLIAISGVWAMGQS